MKEFLFCRHAELVSASNKRGFTLIELLVVVLIIGILSAVALPQYQKAVEKSRAAQAWSVLKSIIQAQQAYYMANGAFADSFDLLDMELAWTGREKWYSGATDTRSNGDWSFQIIDDGGYQGLYMGRLKGPYKGGGFAIFLAASGALGAYKEAMICLERTGSGVAFEGNPGDYCSKIFSGTYVSAQGATRQYRLP